MTVWLKTWTLAEGMDCKRETSQVKRMYVVLLDGLGKVRLIAVQPHSVTAMTRRKPSTAVVGRGGRYRSISLPHGRKAAWCGRKQSVVGT